MITKHFAWLVVRALTASSLVACTLANHERATACASNEECGAATSTSRKLTKQLSQQVLLQKQSKQLWNITFCRGGVRSSGGGGSCTKHAHELHELSDLEVESPSDLKSRFQASPQRTFTASIRSSKLAAAAAAAISQLRLAIADADLETEELHEVLDAHFKEYFDPVTDQFIGRHDKNAKYLRQEAFIKILRLILMPLHDAAASVASETSVFPCKATRIRCGVYDWYLRGLIDRSNVDGDFFDSVHMDAKLMLSAVSQQHDEAWGIGRGAPFAPWWNLWVLLSDDVASSPLALLDPNSLNMSSFWETPDPFVRPKRDRRSDGAKFRFQSARDMKRGDMLLFRSSDVAHGTARLKELPDRYSTTASALDQLKKRWTSNRISFDMRCKCTPHPSDLGPTTERGELCMAAWRPQHENTTKMASSAPLRFGCQYRDGSRPWCVIHARRLSTKKTTKGIGAGCLLKRDGSLCEWPCIGRAKQCSEHYFDYCADPAITRSI